MRTGALVGLATGTVLWHGHRVRGALFGAIEGFLLLLGYWHIYIESSLSRSDGPGMAALKSLAVAWPGVAIGEGYVVTNSGYGFSDHMPGNALLAFAVDGK